MWTDISRAITAASGERFVPLAPTSIGGGCINQAYVLSDGRRRWFVKLNSASSLAMFEAEADGLRELADAAAIRVPQPLTTGCAQQAAFLVMEYIELGGGGAPQALGEQLAALHRCTSAQFGWRRDNTIGATPQINQVDDDWLRFWCRQRLGFQLDLAARKGLATNTVRLGEQLMSRLGGLFVDYRPLPSLLHGDLWGGNVAVDDAGQPVIFDPAVYYGDREADLAMTELFGGFERDFYLAYTSAWPLDRGYETRKMLYNLYHILNHFNLFGGGYGRRSATMIERLLAALR